VPENELPVCVICQVMLPIIEGDNPAPIIDPVESDACPTQVPVMPVAPDVGPLGVVGLPVILPGIDDPPAQAAAASVPAKVRRSIECILLLLSMRELSNRLAS
jgi:hypothetical protein